MPVDALRCERVLGAARPRVICIMGRAPRRWPLRVRIARCKPLVPSWPGVQSRRQERSGHEAAAFYCSYTLGSTVTVLPAHTGQSHFGPALEGYCPRSGTCGVLGGAPRQRRRGLRKAVCIRRSRVTRQLPQLTALPGVLLHPKRTSGASNLSAEPLFCKVFLQKT